MPAHLLTQLFGRGFGNLLIMKIGGEVTVTIQTIGLNELPLLALW